MRHFKTLFLTSVLACAGGFSSLQAEVLLYWDTWSNTTVTTNRFNSDGALAGFSGVADLNSTGSNRYSAANGSNDGTLGSLGSVSASTAGGGLLVRESGNYLTLTFSITNNTGVDYILQSLHFDFGPKMTGPNAFVLSYLGGGLGPASTQIASQSGLSTISGDISNYQDWDLDLLPALSDVTLGHGESAVFTLTFSGQTNNVQSSVFDNLAIVGVAVPEPSSIGLLLLGLAGLGFLRRKNLADRR